MAVGGRSCVTPSSACWTRHVAAGPRALSVMCRSWRLSVCPGLTLARTAAGVRASIDFSSGTSRLSRACKSQLCRSGHGVTRRGGRASTRARHVVVASSRSDLTLFLRPNTASDKSSNKPNSYASRTFLHRLAQSPLLQHLFGAQQPTHGHFSRLISVRSEVQLLAGPYQ